MKAMGVRKKDDDCCPGHAKYPSTSAEIGKPGRRKSGASNKAADKARKAKVRKKPIDLGD
jgi:hypothetical protein